MTTPVLQVTARRAADRAARSQTHGAPNDAAPTAAYPIRPTPVPHSVQAISAYAVSAGGGASGVNLDRLGRANLPFAGPGDRFAGALGAPTEIPTIRVTARRVGSSHSRDVGATADEHGAPIRQGGPSLATPVDHKDKT
jgi:hypothetical protein